MTYFSKKTLTNSGNISKQEDRNKSYIKQVAHIENDTMNMKILNTKVEKNVYLNIVDNIVKKDYKYRLDNKKNYLQIRIILQGNFKKFNPKTNKESTYEENHIVIEYKEDSESFLINKKGEHLKYLCISLGEKYLEENEFLHDILKKQMDQHAISNVFDPILKDRYSELFEREYTSKTDKIYLKNKTMDLIFFVIDKLQKKEQVTSMVDNEDIKRIKKAKFILENNFDKKITIPLLAKKVAINESKLKKGFKELFHSTIREYLVEIRLEKSLEYLQTKNYSVK